MGFREERRKIKLVRLFSWHWQILFGKTQRRKELMMISQFHRKVLLKHLRNQLKMQYSGYDWQKRRILDWNSGRRSRLHLWPTQQYLEIALIVWHQMVEMEYFRTTWNSKATAQGNVEPELAMPAAAAFHFWHRRTELLGTKTEKRKLTWSSRRFETHPWGGPITRQLGAVCFTNGWDSHWWCRRHYEYISKVRTRRIKLLNELKLVQRKFCLHEDPVKESMEFSQESTQAAQDMANVSSSNWGLPKFINVPHADTPYLRRQFFAHVSSLSDRTRRWYNVLGQLFTFSEHFLSARLQFLQEVRSMVINYGNYLLR